MLALGAGCTPLVPCSCRDAHCLLLSLLFIWTVQGCSPVLGLGVPGQCCSAEPTWCQQALSRLACGCPLVPDGGLLVQLDTILVSALGSGKTVAPDLAQAAAVWGMRTLWL